MKRRAVVTLYEVHTQKYLLELEDHETVEDAKTLALDGKGDKFDPAEYAFTMDGMEAIHDAYIVGEE